MSELYTKVPEEQISKLGDDTARTTRQCRGIFQNILDDCTVPKVSRKLNNRQHGGRWARSARTKKEHGDIFDLVQKLTRRKEQHNQQAGQGTVHPLPVRQENEQHFFCAFCCCCRRRRWSSPVELGKDGEPTAKTKVEEATTTVPAGAGSRKKKPYDLKRFT